jgi:hypothetical protein
LRVEGVEVEGMVGVAVAVAREIMDTNKTLKISCVEKR